MYKKREEIPNIKDLRKICKKHHYNASWRIKTLWLVSTPITKLFLHLRLTSRQINWLMTITALIGTLFFLKGEYLTNLIGVLLIHFSTLLDTVDGEVLRFKKDLSHKSGYLDLMSHIIVYPLILTTIGIGTFLNSKTQFPGAYFLIFSFIGTYFLLMINLIRLKKYEHLLKEENIKSLTNESKKLKELKNPYNMKTELKHLFGLGHIFNFLFFFALFNILPYIVVLYGIICPLVFIKNFYKTLKEVEKD